LPTVGTLDKLKELLKSSYEQQVVYDSFFSPFFIARGAIDSVALAEATTSGSLKVVNQAGTNSPLADSVDYSGTNVQVAGVDEADVVKTDGAYLYQVNRSRIIIAKVYPPEEGMEVVATLSMADYQLEPREIYVDGDRLVVIGSSHRYLSKTDPDASANNLSRSPDVSIMPIMPIAPEMGVKTLVYDITDRSSPTLLKEVQIDGHYLNSRKIGDYVYVISNQYLDTYRIMNGEWVPEGGPAVYDSAISTEPEAIGFDRIHYFPDGPHQSYLTISTIDTAQPDQPADHQVYLGTAENVYASTDHLYIALTKYEMPEGKLDGADSNERSNKLIRPYPVAERSTVVHKFRLVEGSVQYVAQGEVPGSVLNQFSMDEHNGYFRIATTKGEVWRTDEHTSTNNVYILDDAMAIAGKLENIAPGERIYSVRFMGNRGYMVTFKKVDPLFVLDLADPFNPSILGKLKIPGYSDYLHPYDENHLIGFGKDTIEATNEWGGDDNSFAYYLGMKVALFDVSDVNNPVEKFVEIIGDRGTDSELLHNHKALLFSKEKGLLAFPVTLYEIPESRRKVENGFPAYGEFTFQGAYVYRIDLENGFQLRGTITHLSDEELRKAGSYWYNPANSVQRILYIGDTLYTLSEGEIRASDLQTLEVKGRLSIAP